MHRTHKVLQGFFWIAFAAFLSASIPHVAYFFRAYEPMDAARDMLWWIVSYGIAISIDVTIFLLSMTVAGLQRQRKAAGLIISVWVFIIGLAALSWFINYKYAEHFINSGMVSPTSVTLPMLGTIADVNPIIASMFQVLAIAYTWISDKIAADEKPKSAAELKAEADELEQALQEKQRIAALKRGGKVIALTGMFDAGKTLVNHIRAASENAAGTQQENAGINAEDDTTFASADALEDETSFATEDVTVKPASAQERNTDKLARINEQDATVKHAENTEQNGGINEQDATRNMASSGATSQKSVTIKEAAQLLGKSESYVRTLVNNGRLRNTPRNKKRILKSSIDALINARENGGKTGAKTPSITTLKIVSDETESTEQNAAELSA